MPKETALLARRHRHFRDVTLLKILMGYLIEKLFKQVNHIAQERGRSYFFNGRVKRIEGDVWRANAKVQGSSLYDVRIGFEDDFLDVQCSCPFLERDLETCKHI